MLLLRNRRTVALLLVVAASISLFGCNQKDKVVYVDTDGILASYVPARQLPVVTPLPTRIEGKASVFSLPAAPQVTASKSLAIGSAKIRDLIEQNRQRTYRTLVQRLHGIYVREAQAIRSQNLSAFDATRQKILANALSQLVGAYLKYADEKGPKIARLAVLAGFPDPDPTNSRPATKDDGTGGLISGRAKTIRADVIKLDASFSAYKNVTLQAGEKEVDRQLTELMASINKSIGDVDARAKAMADKEIERSRTDLGPLLADAPPTILPAEPSRTETLRAPPAVPAPPHFAPPALLGTLEDEKERLHSDLSIWLRLNHYVVGVKKGRDEDVTKDFVAWRKAYAAGNSTQH